MSARERAVNFTSSDASLHLTDACILSGFNLLTAAYSYIVNPDLDMAKGLCRGYRRREAEKLRQLLFHPQVACISKIAPNQCPHSHDGVRLHRRTGCAGDRPSRWAAGLNLTRFGHTHRQRDMAGAKVAEHRTTGDW
jgi:hypothetical protein